MKKFIVLSLLGMLFAATSFANDVAPQTLDHPNDDARMDRLERVINMLERRVTILEQNGGHNPGYGSWSCSAQCGGFRGSYLQSHPVSGGGRSASEAFERMRAACERGEHLFVDVVRDPQTGNRSLVHASIQNACLRD